MSWFFQRVSETPGAEKEKHRLLTVQILYPKISLYSLYVIVSKLVTEGEKGRLCHKADLNQGSGNNGSQIKAPGVSPVSDTVSSTTYSSGYFLPLVVL